MKHVLTDICTGFEPELIKFSLNIFGPSKVLKIPKSSTSRGEKIPGSEIIQKYI